MSLDAIPSDTLGLRSAKESAQPEAKGSLWPEKKKAKAAEAEAEKKKKKERAEGSPRPAPEMVSGLRAKDTREPSPWARRRRRRLGHARRRLGRPVSDGRAPCRRSDGSDDSDRLALRDRTPLAPRRGPSGRRLGRLGHAGAQCRRRPAGALQSTPVAWHRPVLAAQCSPAASVGRRPAG